MGRPRQRQLTPEQADRRAEIVALRRTSGERLTFDQIGQRLGISQQRASELYWETVKSVPARQVEEHRAEELDLAEYAVNDLLALARNHDRPRTAVDAWNAIRGWSERKAKLLGLDAPTLTDTTVTQTEPMSIELTAMIKQAREDSDAAEAEIKGSSGASPES